MPMRTKRPWMQFFVDNPVASVALMRAIRQEEVRVHSKKVDPRLLVEKFLAKNEYR